MGVTTSIGHRDIFILDGYGINGRLEWFEEWNAMPSKGLNFV